MELLYHFLCEKNAFWAGNKSGRGAPAGLIPSREAAPPAPSAKELDISVKVGLKCVKYYD